MKIPVGRHSSTTTRITKATVSLYSVGTIASVAGTSNGSALADRPQQHRPVEDRQRLGKADQEAARDGAIGLAEAADDRRRKDRQHDVEGEVGLQRHIERQHGAGHAGERAGDDPGDPHHQLGVDARNLRQIGIVGHGAHRLAQPRAGEEEDAAPAPRRRSQTTISTCGWVKLMVRVTPSSGTGMRISCLGSVSKNDTGARAEEQPDQALDHQRHADRGDQQRHRPGAALAAAARRSPCRGRARSTAVSTMATGSTRKPVGRNGAAMPSAWHSQRQQEGDEGAHRHHVAMGEMRKAQDAEDQRHADGADAHRSSRARRRRR